MLIGIVWLDELVGGGCDVGGCVVVVFVVE